MRFFAFLTALLLTATGLAQTNTYHSVVEISRTDRWVRTTANPPVNTAVLLYQHRGATLAANGAVAALNGAGHYALNRVDRRGGDTLFLRFPIQQDFELVHTQLVVHTTADSLTVTGTLTADQSFDGSRGGVLFLAATERLTLAADATLDVSGQGFAGGEGQEADSDCNRFTSASDGNYPLGNWRGAAKGQGIATVPADRAAGRNPAANGGGGGNDHNAGGGGGGNVTAGGAGARNVVEGLFNNACRGNFPGLAGRALTEDQDRVFFGGGGGAGHANNTTLAAGGNGGGLVVLWAPTIDLLPGSSISSRGAGAGAVEGDGGGGGGAGGTALFLVNDLIGQPTVDVSGGGGADVESQADRCFGPGGGGAGGRILIRRSGQAANVSATLVGGPAGLRLGSDECAPTDEPAGTGTPGVQQTTPLTNFPFPGFDLSDSLLCAADTLFINDRSSGGDRVDFRLEPATPSLRLVTADGRVIGIVTDGTVSGEYTLVQLVFAGAERFTASTPFRVLPSPRVEDVTLTRSDATVTVTLTGATAADALRYDFGDGTIVDTTATTLSHTYQAGDDYPVSVTLFNAACGDLRIDTLVAVIPAFAVARTDEKDFIGCAPLTITVTDVSTGTYDGRLWSFPGAEPATSDERIATATYPEPGDYVATLRLLNALGRDTVATVRVTVFAQPVADFSIAVDTATAVFTSLAVDADTLRWSFGDGGTSLLADPVHTYGSTGSFPATLIATNGPCRDTLTQTVVIDVLSDVQELAELGVRVFPNPVQGVLQLTGPAIFLGAYDALGRWLPANGTTTLTTVGWPAGTYSVVLKTGGKQYTVRVVR